ncbi:MAG: membrane protein insertase YidC [Lentisphaerae bacterium]|nr:membrane protein insertase YidC [Lentisphaerota bacterium]
MNWDKQSVAAVVIGALVLIGWFIYGPQMTGGDAPEEAAVEEVKSDEAESAEKTGGSEAAAPKQAEAKKPAVEEAKKPAVEVDKEVIKPIEAVSISAGGSTYYIQPAYGTVEKVVFSEKFLHNKDKKSPIELTGNFDRPDFRIFGIRPEDGEFRCVEIIASKKVSDSEYTLSRRLDNGVVITTNYKADGEYGLQVSVKFSNPTDKSIAMQPLLVSAGDMQPWPRLSGDKPNSSSDVMTLEYCTESNKTEYEKSSIDEDDLKELQGKPVRWFGTTNRFFAMLIKPAEGGMMQFERMPLEEKKEYAVNASAQFKSFTLAPNGEKEFKFDYFLGPKFPKNLEAFDPEARDVMHLGWFPFGFLAHIMLKVMNLIYALIGSFGVSIILLTLLVRMLFFPITMKANDSMREMQVLAPKLKEIREKYKNEPVIAQTKMSELYREHKVNPLSGCLPMLIQIPVFIALYYALGSAAELRHQSFLWIKDLAQPDTVFTVFGLGINPLIIAWTALMVVQQKLTPTAMDPMQAKIMLVMPLVMLFILYTLPAALTLYWTVSQMFSIAQLIYQNKRRKKLDSAQKPQDNTTEKPKVVRS